MTIAVNSDNGSGCSLYCRAEYFYIVDGPIFAIADRRLPTIHNDTIATTLMSVLD